MWFWFFAPCFMVLWQVEKTRITVILRMSVILNKEKLSYKRDGGKVNSFGKVSDYIKRGNPNNKPKISLSYEELEELGDVVYEKMHIKEKK